MIRVFIIEDEQPAVKKMIQMLNIYNSNLEICGTAASIKESVGWLKANSQPDLILLDIQLTDGLSLDIFKKVKITCPIIFTTAFDEYILQALKYNGIDYLLKPVKQKDLNRAFNKYLTLKSHFSLNIEKLFSAINKNMNQKKSRITVKDGIHFKSIKVEDIAFFFTEFKIVFLVLKSGEKYVVDKSLTELTNEFDSRIFFRINRKFLANIEAIKKFKSFDKGKILIELLPKVNEEIIVSQEKAAQFRKWIEK